MSIPIIVALDKMVPGQALAMAEKLSGQDLIFKVHSAFDHLEGGIALTRNLSKFGKIMLDMKVHDTPETCGDRVASLFQHPGAEIVTIHLSAGEEALINAVKATPRGKILAGITVLTSLDKDDLAKMNINNGPGEQVLTMAKMGVRCGIQTIVCSAQEARVLKSDPETAHLKLITPGITPSFTEKAKGQKRTTSPKEAVDAGSDFLVIGSGIVKQPDPLEALQKVRAEIAG